MDLYSILACPNCKVSVRRVGDHLSCPQCGRNYPIVDGVPVLLPDGSVPSTLYQHDLKVRPVYDPWVHRVVMQSLPASAITLDMGAGNLTLNLPNVIRMDVTLTPYVDVVGDAHALPFLPGTLDFVFSLAVIEHLRQPFDAAQEMFRVLRNGGYVYGECNFVFAYHGYPHHYFNASEQGLEQVFSIFHKFRTGVAPFQLPSAALRMVLRTYLQSMTPSDEPNVAAFRLLLHEVIEQPLGTYDGLFTEEAALNVAAGTFFFGRKVLPGPTEVIPQVVQSLWEQEPEIKTRFPDLFDLGSVPNIMLWAKGEGREQYPAIDEYFRSVLPVRKSATVDDSGSEMFEALPVLDTHYYTIPELAAEQPSRGDEDTLRQRVATLTMENDKLTGAVAEQNTYIRHLASHIDEKTAYIKKLEATVKQRDAQLRTLQSRTRLGGVARLVSILRRPRRG